MGLQLAMKKPKLPLYKRRRSGRYSPAHNAPCPLVFDADDVSETMKLDAEQNEADEMLEVLQNKLGVGPEGWMPTEHYEEAVTRTRQLKEEALAAAETADERAEVATHWPFDDMDEEKYM